MKTKPYYWLAQFVGWGSYCGLLTLITYNRGSVMGGVFLFNILVILMSGMLITHIQRMVFMRLGWLELRLPRLLPRLILSSVLCALTMSFVDAITDYATGWNVINSIPISISGILASTLSALLLFLFWNAIYFTYHFFSEIAKQEISNLELTASKRESELKNLRSQLNPHFLFNSLNSIRALVDVEPAKAKVSITTLSNLLRQSLVLGRENLVSLESELELAKNYLDLEKIRFEERLKVNWKLVPGLEHFEIPPFSLQMLVENAIKHGISNLKDGGIVEISAYENGEEVVIQVKNSGTLDGIVDLGVGIQNIKQRLAIQYGNGASFELNERNQEVIAQMKFKK